ncbi:hypothetical protein GA0070617_2159 [Micromonospora yangpuensis]|uniref:Uncharacterized protein n=1 Tax=Micromonospora yangpuensis TaxID=683228 RepID=A0A1C6UFH3_9ACTN|nr:hypothetical protein GA0070617_2159 [Micromonospora yangpuensis]
MGFFHAATKQLCLIRKGSPPHGGISDRNPVESTSIRSRKIGPVSSAALSTVPPTAHPRMMVHTRRPSSGPTGRTVAPLDGRSGGPGAEKPESALRRGTNRRFPAGHTLRHRAASCLVNARVRVSVGSTGQQSGTGRINPDAPRQAECDATRVVRSGMSPRREEANQATRQRPFHPGWAAARPTSRSDLPITSGNASIHYVTAPATFGKGTSRGYFARPSHDRLTGPGTHPVDSDPTPGMARSGPRIGPRGNDIPHPTVFVRPPGVGHTGSGHGRHRGTAGTDTRTDMADAV